MNMVNNCPSLYMVQLREIEVQKGNAREGNGQKTQKANTCLQEEKGKEGAEDGVGELEDVIILSTQENEFQTKEEKTFKMSWGRKFQELGQLQSGSNGTGTWQQATWQRATWQQKPFGIWHLATGSLA